MAVDKNKLEEEACVHCFYKIVLSWDYLRVLKDSRKNNKNIGDGSALGLKEVKDTYKDVDDYLATFEPLLFEEVKAQIVQGKDKEEDVTEWAQGMTAECGEVDGFYFPVVICVTAESISQNDLLLLSNKKFGEGKGLPTAYAFALEHRQQDKIRLRMNLSGEVKGFNIDEVQDY